MDSLDRAKNPSIKLYSLQRAPSRALRVNPVNISDDPLPSGQISYSASIAEECLIPCRRHHRDARGPNVSQGVAQQRRLFLKDCM